MERINATRLTKYLWRDGRHRRPRDDLVAGVRVRRGGGSDYGDSYVNDSVKNPRFIEPYSDYDPARYRVYHHREGYYDRQRAARGYDDRGYGRVEVRPFGF